MYQVGVRKAGCDCTLFNLIMNPLAQARIHRKKPKLNQ